MTDQICEEEYQEWVKAYAAYEENEEKYNSCLERVHQLNRLIYAATQAAAGAALNGEQERMRRWADGVYDAARKDNEEALARLAAGEPPEVHEIDPDDAVDAEIKKYASQLLGNAEKREGLFMPARS